MSAPLNDPIALCEAAQQHFGAGRIDLAGSVLEGAVAASPRNPVPRALLGDALAALGRSEEAIAEYQAALALEPHLIGVHLRLAQALSLAGRFADALEHVKAGYRPVHSYESAYCGTGVPVRVLQLGSANVAGLTGTDYILDPQIFNTTTIAVQYWDRNRALPPHDVVFNSIADPDVCGPALDVADWILSLTDAPVLNAPASVRPTGRIENAARFAHLPDVVSPEMKTVAKQDLQAAGALGYPLLLRSPGHHNGKHFLSACDAAELAQAAQTLPGDSLIAMQFVDTRDSGGRFRKYRAMIVDGKLYPAHLAVSAHWNVHYFSAQMGASERAEEERFLRDMPAALGPRAMRALESIAAALELDYAGIDFGLNDRGEVVVFEANAAMTVYLPDASAETICRREAALTIFRAAQDLILARASLTQPV